jgi:hypothetical protein
MIAVSQLGVGSASGHNARACICQTRADAMACLGCAGVGVGVPSQWLFGHLAGSDPFEARSALQKRKGTQLVPSLKPTPESQQAADFLLRFPIAEFAGPPGDQSGNDVSYDMPVVPRGLLGGNVRMLK